MTYGDGAPSTEAILTWQRQYFGLLPDSSSAAWQLSSEPGSYLI